MISCIVLTKNEENNIVDCIQSVLWCDEVIVIDDNSTDNTIERAKKTGVKVINHELGNDFAAQRNFALQQAQNEWVLFVDSDERVSEKLKNEIINILPKTDVNGFYLKRLDTMWGKQLIYGETGDIKLLRLARKGKGKWISQVHERWEVGGKTEVLKNPIIHFPHPTIAAFLQKINFYTTLRAEELYQQRVKTNFFLIILYPKAKFIQNFVLKLGFLDGMPGFIFALLMSFHSFLVRGKLWLLWQKAQ